MITAEVGMQGTPPILEVGQGNPEAAKYGKLWEMPEYRQCAPGEVSLPLFLEHAKPRPDATLIDFGCGTGRGAIHLASKAGLKVTLVDFVRNCLDVDVREWIGKHPDRAVFLKADLEHPIPAVAAYGYVTDVMEHIPEMRVDRVLENILTAAQHVFFAIATKQDVCGKLIGEDLHVTVRSYSWWLKRLNDCGAVIHWSKKEAGRCFFYVSAWVDGHEVIDSGRLNTNAEQIAANVRNNIRQGYEQLVPHGTCDLECMILGSGPSLSQFEEDIRAKRAAGVKLVTLNGAYNWCVERGITPSAQVMVDAREFNKRFTRPVVDGCKYLLASQCHPAVFEGLPKDRTYLWHVADPAVKDILTEQYEAWMGVPGGSSVLLRAIPLMRTLGYRMFHLYGCDSCIMDAQHHAFSQPENDAGVILPVTLTDGRIFYAHPWMIAQAQEWITLIAKMGDVIDLAVYGDGLLRHILETGAALASNND